MEISGPLAIGYIDNDSGGRELHLSFRPEFRGLTLPQQSEAFRQFIDDLKQGIQPLAETDPNRMGMLTILQICEQLQPHIDANELPLEETIVVTIQSQNPFGNIQIVN